MNNTSINRSVSLGRLIYFSIFLIVVLSLIQMINLSTRLFAISLFFLLPTIIAIMIDKHEDKCLSLCVGLCNVSGILTYIPELLVFSSLNASMSFINSLPKLSDVIFVYSFSAIGFIIYLTIPSLVAFSMIFSIESKKRNLEKKIESYRRKWEI